CGDEIAEVDPELLELGDMSLGTRPERRDCRLDLAKPLARELVPHPFQLEAERARALAVEGNAEAQKVGRRRPDEEGIDRERHPQRRNAPAATRNSRTDRHVGHCRSTSAVPKTSGSSTTTFIVPPVPLSPMTRS